MEEERELILTTERVFEIELPAHDLLQVRSLGDMCNLVVTVMNSRCPEVPYSFEQIWPAIQEITSEVLGVREDELTPELEYAKDLNV